MKILVAVAALAATAAQAQEPRVPSGMQWLYGSGEGAATNIQAYHAFRDYVVAAARHRPRDSVVLADGATLAAPRFLPCGRRPLAVVLDADETVLQNLGYEYDDASHPGRPYDQERWNRWERTGANAVAPIPGAVTALRAIRRAGVTVIFNSNRLAAAAAENEAALNGAGLGPARHGSTLWLQGDAAPGSAKDPRRAAISAHYCVIAMAGDQLGDFSDLFNARGLSVPDRRRAAAAGPLAALWGNGWFVLSNPVYGSGLRGTIDEVFPADRRWADPQEGSH
jgi:5'-nucleotidase (lipoprotein e(P4) family)